MCQNVSMLSRNLNVVAKDGRKHVFSMFMNFADALVFNFLRTFIVTNLAILLVFPEK